MGWYKKAQMQHPKDMDDRNVLNDKIHFFEDLGEQVRKLSKVVFQDGVYAQNATLKIATDKKLSSHPELQDLMIEANRIALDSPWKFADICLMTVEQIEKRIADTKRLRKKLVEDILPRKMRGWVDKHGE
jgi:hypothetical protein